LESPALGTLIGVLVLLLALSAFFSGSETSLMTLNRYRLRHLASQGHGGARRALKLLERPDRLIGLILVGNNFVNSLLASIAALVAVEVGGVGGGAVAIAATAITVLILIFGEVAPKTLAALHPERIGFPAAYVYSAVQRVFYPVVWGINGVANGMLRLLGVDPEQRGSDALSREELRTLVLEAGSRIPKRHQRMLVGILDLEKATAEDIMIPRSEVSGIDLGDPVEDALEFLRRTTYTRIPVWEGSIDHVLGILHVRDFLQSVMDDAEVTTETLRGLLREPHFIPEGTPLTTLLVNLQRARQPMGLVVDEYGDLQGIVTFPDLLEEIVGEFTTDPQDSIRDVHPQADGSVLVDGTANVRELVRTLGWELPTDGPKTLNGLILEQLESIPETGTSLLIAGYPVEILQVQDNAVRVARVYPAMRRREATAE
jgi:Mg2+/Co2+ transporter CorB